MKILKFAFSFLFASLVIGCASNDDIFSVVDAIDGPSNISAVFTITQDNSGLVSITPLADGAATFDVYFGDGTEEHEEVVTGESISRVYTEGNFDVRIVAVALNGKTAEAIKPLVVSFQTSRKFGSNHYK